MAFAAERCASESGCLLCARWLLSCASARPPWRRRTVVNRRPPLLTRAVFPAPAPGLRNLADGGPDPALLPRLKPYLARLDGNPGKYGDAENRAALVKLAARQFKSDGVVADSIAV